MYFSAIKYKLYLIPGSCSIIFIVNLLQWMLYVVYVNVALYGIEVD